MEHWQSVLPIPIITIHYEDLVDKQADTTRALLEFCELDWQDSCLDFHKSRRFVATASYDQVRKPIYKGSVGRWRNRYPAACTPGIIPFPDLQNPRGFVV